jgi:S-(hydroxymethyl)mycothiol dehydrogenase
MAGRKTMPITARGAIARTPGAAASIEEYTVDDPGPNEVLVRIVASGVCHTDYGVKMGHYGTDGFPFLLGHEGAGIVEAVGPGVQSPKVGDHVILAWRAPCEQCRFCRAGKPNLCANSLNAEKRMKTMDGVTLNPVLGIGTFCTHTVVHAKQAIVIDHDLPSAQMSLIGCGVMTGVGAAFYSAKVEPGSTVAVFGCGGVGDSVIMGSKLAGATTIIAVDIDPKKLEWAEQFGATHAINPNDGDPVAKIKEITGGFGVNFSFECAGLALTAEQALWSRDLAGTCVLIGVHNRDAKFELPLANFFDLGGNFTVSWYGNCLPTRDFPALAAWYEQGKLDLDNVVSEHISLDQIEEAFARMGRGETLRSVIVFES